jgi:uncharacterized membrane protein YphA (DoxX/SURF4 family)
MVKVNDRMSKSIIVGWILTVLLSLILIVLSASGKFRDFPGKAEQFAKLGWTEDVMYKVAVVEIAITVLFLIPRTAFLGAVLLTAYLGGATSAHVRIGDNFVFPIVIGVLVWVALGLRDPRIFTMALGGGGDSPATKTYALTPKSRAR